MSHPVLVEGVWIQDDACVDTFRAFEPARGKEIEDVDFPVSDWPLLQRMLEAGVRASDAMASLPPASIAAFLRAYADAIERDAERLVACAHAETALPVEPRLAKVELPRTTGQLRQAANAVEHGGWRRPTIDSAANIRSIHAPLGGPVWVIGPNNFPFAFNAVAGSDFAGAIAAGNPVIAKAHPGHPRTSALLAGIAAVCAAAHGLPPAALQMFFHVRADTGLRLAADPALRAIAFTGSRSAGLALKAAADRAGTPFFAEMSSINPVFFLGGALRERGEALAAELHASCTLGAGQFCTRPGLAVLAHDASAEAFARTLQQRMNDAPPGVLLAPHSPHAVAMAIDRLRDAGARVLAGGVVPTDATGFAFPPTLLSVSGSDFLARPGALQGEAFGPVCLLVRAESAPQLQAIAALLEGGLTASVYSHTQGDDDVEAEVLSRTLRSRVGRLLNDRMPTGVAVSPAMNHGGPFPATTHPAFTAVGMPASILRFTALHCYDNVREARLPPELRDRNPDPALQRWIDGEWTTRDVRRPAS